MFALGTLTHSEQFIGFWTNRLFVGYSDTTIDHPPTVRHITAVEFYLKRGGYRLGNIDKTKIIPRLNNKQTYGPRNKTRP